MCEEVWETGVVKVRVERDHCILHVMSVSECFLQLSVVYTLSRKRASKQTINDFPHSKNVDIAHTVCLAQTAFLTSRTRSNSHDVFFDK